MSTRRLRRHPGLLALLLSAIGLVFAAPVALATPPDHAPAHGYRAKQGDTKPEAREPEKSRGGIEVVYDSERGIHVGVNRPDVFFLDGIYYRQSSDGSWEVSATGDGKWSVSAGGGVPEKVAKAGRAQPGPAKRDQGSKKRK